MNLFKNPNLKTKGLDPTLPQTYQDFLHMYYVHTLLVYTLKFFVVDVILQHIADMYVINSSTRYM